MSLTLGQLKEQANKRTENRGKVLNLDTEALFVIQELCKYRRWPWRRKSFTFNTVAGTATYNLNTQSGATQIEFEQLAERGVKLFINATDYYILTPITDQDEQDEAQEATAQDIPGQYMLEPESTSTLRLYPIPGAVYKVRVSGWCVPNYDIDAVPETIPLVPGHLHNLLAKWLEERILEFTDGGAKYLAAMKERERLLSQACAITEFENGRKRDWSDQSGESIRSTY